MSEFYIQRVKVKDLEAFADRTTPQFCIFLDSNPYYDEAQRRGKTTMTAGELGIAPGPPPVPQPVPRNQWPSWAQAMADSFEPEDRGIGDVVHRKLDAGGQLASLALKAMGVPCGCDERRNDWNVMYANPTCNPRNQ